VVRDNRFRVTVKVDGQEVWAHLPNSGRLGELMIPGRRVLLAERPLTRRKTRYDLLLIELDGQWVSVDARLPNALVEEALCDGRLTAFHGYSDVRREVVFGRSRLDFRLEGPGKLPCLVEVKSVTLIVDGLACFPDAVTLRGRRHVEELASAAQEGYRAAVVFCIQRGDALGFRPHDESDPAFGEALRKAVRCGVQVYAHACRIAPSQIELAHALPVHLGEDHPGGAIAGAV
jgi:sugar fermentation stimulation protein A